MKHLMMDSATGQKGQKMQILKEKIVRYETDGSIVKGYDAGELVRCKDCQYYVDECCERYADETLGYVHSTQPDYFCAVAARKEE